MCGQGCERNAALRWHGEAHLLPGGALQAREHIDDVSGCAHLRVTLKLHQSWHLHGHRPTQRNTTHQARVAEVPFAALPFFVVLTLCAPQPLHFQ